MSRLHQQFRTEEVQRKRSYTEKPEHVAVDYECELCQTGVKQASSLFIFLVSKFQYAGLILQNTLSKINHSVLDGRWQPNINHISLKDKVIQEHQYQLYSEDHECYIVMVGVQVIISKYKHDMLCKNIVIEIDMPVPRQYKEMSNYALARLQDAAKVLSKAYKPGITILSQRVTHNCYKNKLITILKEIQQEYLIQEGFTRLITYTHQHEVPRITPHLSNILHHTLQRRVANNLPDQGNVSKDIITDIYNR